MWKRVCFFVLALLLLAYVGIMWEILSSDEKTIISDEAKGTVISNDRYGEDVPDPLLYDMTEQAKCSTITDYAYDKQGRLVHETRYGYSDHTKPKFGRDSDTVYVYDEQGRLLRQTETSAYLVGGKSSHEGTPSYVYEYEYTYREDGSYTKHSYDGDVIDYDSEGRVVSAHVEKTWNHYTDFSCVYDENGYLKEAYLVNSGGDTAVTAFRYEEGSDGSRIGLQGWQREDGMYIVWMDYYDSEERLIATCYDIGEEDLFSQDSFAWIEGYCRPGYQARYDGNKLVEEISDQIDRDIRYSYAPCEYRFYDYDEAGRLIWSYWCLASGDNRLYASQYFYDENGRKAREVKYTIYGNWEHTLYDGTTIWLVRNEDERITNISRYHADGGMMYCYEFQPSKPGNQYLRLCHTKDERGEISAIWEMPLSYYQSIYGELGDFGKFGNYKNHDPEIVSGETIYYVQKGDCLWYIAEKFMGDGRRWAEIYERNRAQIGSNPSLIYEGMALSW